VGEQHIYRVTVRGRFSQLSDGQRDRLVKTLDDHHLSHAAYTVDGTFTYDAALYAFSLRYEIRVSGEDPEATAAERGLAQSEGFLRTLGFGYHHLVVTTADMRSMWQDVAERKSR
jgi:Family of unknown function (DUF6204)